MCIHTYTVLYMHKFDQGRHIYIQYMYYSYSSIIMLTWWFERVCVNVFYSDYLFKLLLIGDSGVGKSCLLLRFAVSPVHFLVLYFTVWIAVLFLFVLLLL